VIVEGLGIPESIRWHGGRTWLCNWGSGEIVAVGPGGEREVSASVEARALPFSIDWLPDGRMLVVDGPNGLLLRQGADGSLEQVADLGQIGGSPMNEIVVDRQGNAFVNGGRGTVVRLDPAGQVTKLVDGLKWPNGMALLDEDSTLVVADSHARQLVAFDVTDRRRPLRPRIWADLEHAPDGICADPAGGVWSATVPGERCERIAEGGQVIDVVGVDRGCFSCALGGEDERTLFIGAAVWRGMQATMTQGPGETGRLLATAV
jgi:sugar lactone lactonase YvrE